MTWNTPTILLTRPSAAALGFAEKLNALGVVADLCISPVQAIENTPDDIGASFAGAIFTSKNGVAAVPGCDLPCWCVGDSTAESARVKGWKAVSAAGDVEDLIDRILSDNPKTPLVHFRGAFARGNLAERLTDQGIETREQIVYRQVSQPLTQDAKARLARGNPVILPLFSPRSAAQVVQQGPFQAPIWVVAMSEAVAAEASALGPTRLIVAEEPTADAMIAAIKQMVNAVNGIEGQKDST